MSCLFAFPAVREYAHNRQLVTPDTSSHDAPMLLFHSLPPSITTPYLGVLLESWLHLGPSRLGAISVTESAADSSPVSRLLFSAHVLTLNCLENRKGVEAAMKKENRSRSWKAAKKKKDDVSKCFLCNNFYPSHTFLLKATLLGTQKWVFLFGNNSRRASEATVKLLQSRCFFLSPINLTPTPPLSSFKLALAHQF